MIIPIPDCGKGVNKDLLPSELAPGVWSNAVNFRFRKGFAETFEGGTVIATMPVTVYWVAPYANTTTKYLIAAGSAKVYARYENATPNVEITRYTEGATISSITRVGTTATLTTATNHGLSTGQTVSVWGALPADYNGTYVITVTAATTFTYVMAADPGASASPVGLYSYNGATSNFTGGINDRWTGGSLNGIMIVNNPVNGLYYWNGDTALRLRKVPLSYVADAARTFKNYIIQLAPTVSGTKYPYRVAWSNAAEPGTVPTTFTAAATNDAGDQELAETPGPLIDCLPLGDVNIVYKNDAIYTQQYIGGEFVFRFTRVDGTDGLFARGCVVNTPKGHVFLSQKEDVRLFDGGSSRSIADGRVKDWLASLIGPAFVGVGIDSTGVKSFLVVHSAKSEVWVVFSNGVTGTTGFCDTAAVWNWEDDTWGIFEFPATANLHYAASGDWPATFRPNLTAPLRGDDVVFATNSDQVGLVSGYDGKFMLNTFTKTLTREGIDGGDQNTFKSLHRSRWNFDATAGTTATVSHGSSKFASASATYASGVTYTVGTTNFVDARATGGRYVAVSIVAGATLAGSLRSGELDVTSGGTR